MAAQFATRYRRSFHNGASPAPVLLLAMFINVSGCVAEPTRSFSGGVFHSEFDPEIRVRIDPAFRYLGYDRFVLKEIADVERHHWVKSTDGVVDALVVFQFEGLLDGKGAPYEFNIPAGEGIAGSNYRFTPEPVRLGDQEYVHNTWAFDNRASAAENPGAESNRTLQFLARHDLRIDDGLIMSRYVRAVGDEQRKEIILFYMEPLSRSGHKIDEFQDGDPPTEKFDRLSANVVARGRAVIEVLSE